jgi:hypothetical protein
MTVEKFVLFYCVEGFCNLQLSLCFFFVEFGFTFVKLYDNWCTFMLYIFFIKWEVLGVRAGEQLGCYA